MPNQYKCLNKQVFSSGEYSLVPIRMQDRYDIMRWRNEQMYHLRQNKPLGMEDQDHYFFTVVAGLFEQEQPNQILFSFLKKEECIGYGGLVHINWKDCNAEISFVLKTDIEKDEFISLWSIYLMLIKQLSFKHLNFHKIYTYAFDIRPELYPTLEIGGLVEEARLKAHCFVDGVSRDVVYHACINPKKYLEFRDANNSDAELLFNWVNDPDVRLSALNSDTINWDDHLNWFENKLKSENSKIYIFQSLHKRPIGQVRIDLRDGAWVIDFSIDKTFRGLGLGKDLIREIIKHNEGKKFLAEVRLDNFTSQSVFEKMGFEKIEINDQRMLYKFPK